MRVVAAAVATAGFMAIGALYPLLHAQQEQTTRSVWDGVYTEEQAQRGQALSNKYCASCHGDGLTGGEQAPPLAGGGFLANWDGLTVGDLFERIRVTMPADNPGKLSRQENADILAYVFAVNKFPAGKSELERQTEILKTIKFLANNPNEKK